MHFHRRPPCPGRPETNLAKIWHLHRISARTLQPGWTRDSSEPRKCDSSQPNEDHSSLTCGTIETAYPELLQKDAIEGPLRPEVQVELEAGGEFFYTTSRRVGSWGNTKPEYNCLDSLHQKDSPVTTSSGKHWSQRLNTTEDSNAIVLPPLRQEIMIIDSTSLDPSCQGVDRATICLLVHHSKDVACHWHRLAC